MVWGWAVAEAVCGVVCFNGSGDRDSFGGGGGGAGLGAGGGGFDFDGFEWIFGLAGIYNGDGVTGQ